MMAMTVLYFYPHCGIRCCIFEIFAVEPQPYGELKLGGYIDTTAKIRWIPVESQRLTAKESEKHHDHPAGTEDEHAGRDEFEASFYENAH